MSGRASPRVSLIVATRGRSTVLARLLRSVAESELAPYEVIIVDQNPPGTIDDLLDGFQGRLPLVHVRSRPGLSVARNHGLSLCGGDVVAFPDDDCWYPPHLLGAVLGFFDRHADIGILLGRTVDAEGVASVSPTRAAAGPVTPENIWFSGNSNTIFLRGAAAARTRFDEGLGVGAPTPFQSGEETDFLLRCLNGRQVGWYDPSIVVHHDQVASRIGWSQIGRSWRYGAGFGQVLRRHYPWRYGVWRIARTVLSAFRWGATGRLRRAGDRLAWAFGTIRGYVSQQPTR